MCSKEEYRIVSLTARTTPIIAARMEQAIRHAGVSRSRFISDAVLERIERMEQEQGNYRVGEQKTPVME